MADGLLRCAMPDGAWQHPNIRSITMAKCGACGAPEAPSKCSKCSLVSYCNKNCQMNHWNEHQKVCESAAAADFVTDKEFAEMFNSALETQNSSPVTEVTSPARIKASKADFSAPSSRCIARIHTDMKALAKDPLEGILVEHDENRVNVCHALILGPSDTPYEFGLFYFLVEYPDQYPIVPPRVTLKTTGGGKVRFNPNLYPSGKVCLSILGTWEGPSWSPVQNTGSVLLSIQSLMNSTPYFNEPGFENKPAQESRMYNHIIRHETIRVAVLDILATGGKFLPPLLKEAVRDSFSDFSEVYKYNCDEYAFLDGRQFKDPLWVTNRGTFQFQKMKARIEQIQEEMDKVSRNHTLTTDDSTSPSACIL